LRSVLAERFKLAVHRDSKVLPAYALSVGKSGPKLHHSETSGGPSLSFPRGKISGQRVSMEKLAEVLSYRLNHPVVDRRELKGLYDVTLEWMEERDADNIAGGDRRIAPTGGVSRPSIFTAIQEQLGLRLQAEKLPVETVVVDAVERVPTAN